jgi:four helix bundle protein
VAKPGVVLEEADESAFWLELLIETGTLKRDQVNNLLTEALELTALFNASRTTIRRG